MIYWNPVSITKAWFPSQKCAHLGFKCSTSHDFKTGQQGCYCHLKDPDSSQRPYWSSWTLVINWDFCYWTSFTFWAAQCHNWIGNRVSHTYIEGLQPASPGYGVRSSLELHGHYEAIVAILNEGVNTTSRLDSIYVNFFCLWIPENVPGFQKALEIKQHQKCLECLEQN